MEEPSDRDERTRALRVELHTEYYKILHLVSAFDQRLLTIKGWGVTLSLASLGLGFQQDHYGLFLVAGLSGVAFWIVEATTKAHQMRYYPRLRDIEVACHVEYGAEAPAPLSSPLIDWGWHAGRVRRRPPKKDEKPEDRPDPHRPTAVDDPSRTWRWWDRLSSPLWMPHVMFPHVVAVGAGAILFFIGLAGHLGPI